MKKTYYEINQTWKEAKKYGWDLHSNFDEVNKIVERSQVDWIDKSISDEQFINEFPKKLDDIYQEFINGLEKIGINEAVAIEIAEDTIALELNELLVVVAVKRNLKDLLKIVQY